MKGFINFFSCTLCVLLIALSSCHHAEKQLIGEFERYSQELMENCHNYSTQQWNEATQMLDAFSKDFKELNLTNVEKERVRMLMEICNQYLDLQPVYDLQRLSVALDSCEYFHQSQWDSIHVVYDSIVSMLDKRVYSQERKNMIGEAKKKCIAGFSQEPIMKLQVLCDRFSREIDSLTYQQRNQLHTEYLQVCNDLAQYDYDYDSKVKIEKWCEVFDKYFEATKWSSVGHTVESYLKDFL